MQPIKNTLPNGARYIIFPKNNNTKTFTLLILFKSGSRNEPKGLFGAAHFIEHLMFKGTKKRPTAQHISKELDNIGAEYNAFTAKDHTGFYIKTSSSHTELACELLSDLIWNSTFNEQEMEREKKVIIEEIKMYEENPLMRIDDIFEKELYRGNPLSRIISGEKKDVLQYQRKDILSFRYKFYGPQNMLITAVGEFDMNMKKFLTKYFGKNNFPWRKPSKIRPFFSTQKKPRIIIEKKDLSQVQVAIGFTGINMFNPKIYQAKLLAIILGGNMSSRLFTTVREKYGLAYSISAHIKTFEDTGHLVIYGGIDLERIDKSLTIILRELKKIRDRGVSQKELNLSREFIKGKTILALENSSAAANYYGKQELFKHSFLYPEDMFKKFDQVSCEDIKKIAQQIIKKSKLNIALIGPFESLSKFDTILKLL